MSTMTCVLHGMLVLFLPSLDYGCQLPFGIKFVQLSFNSTLVVKLRHQFALEYFSPILDKRPHGKRYMLFLVPEL